MKKIVLSFVCVLFFSVSVFSAKMPGWVKKGKSKEYPQGKYLVGIGMGENLDSARSNAMAEIAKVFGAQIEQISEDVNTSKITTKGKKSKESSEMDSATKTNVTVGENIEGIEIVDNWFNKKKEIHYAMAVLDKRKMVKTLSEKISDLEEHIKNQVDLAHETPSSIDRIRALTRALVSTAEKEYFVNRRRVIDSADVPDLPSGFSKSDIINVREKAIKNVVFVVDSGEHKKLKSAVNDRITGMGFKVSDSIPENKARSVVLVKCNTQISPLDRGHPKWKFYSWKINVDMKEVSSKEGSFAAISEKGQSSHLSVEAAKSKAEADSESKLASVVEERIKHYVFGGVE
ncbi:LPP20 family lipoprotein [Elusimicrobiota bacterium]